jgi:hypothetical protein
MMKIKEGQRGGGGKGWKGSRPMQWSGLTKGKQNNHLAASI